MTGRTHEKSDSAIIRMMILGYQGVRPVKGDDQALMKIIHMKKATANGLHRLTGDSQKEAARTLENLPLKMTVQQPPENRIHKLKAREK